MGERDFLSCPQVGKHLYCSYRKVISGHGSNGDALKHRRIEKTNGACAESEHLAEDTAEKPAEGRAGLESV